MLAALFCAVIFPEIILKHEISFVTFNDYTVDYTTTFALTTFFYQGGIQLWDFFGQMPHTFLMTTLGMFQLPGILTALSFVLLSPFADNSAQCFHAVFSVVYILTMLGIRTVGLLLLLRCLTGNKWILTVGVVIFSLLFTPSAMMIGTFYQSFYPLLMCFILSFFMTFRPVYLMMAGAFLAIALSHGFVHTCYMYLGIHFFIIACLVWALIVRRKEAKQWVVSLKKPSVRAMASCACFALFAAVVLAPYFYIQLYCLKDFVVGLQQSRIAHMWDPSWYFHKLMLDVVPYQDFFRRMLDFTFEPGWAFFLGYMLLFLSAVGLIMSRDSRKWIFAATILLVWSINFPRETASIGLAGHWLNVLTNPFKTMVRSYQMASHSFVPYLFIPLAVLGIEVLVARFKGLTFERSWRRWILLIGTMVGFVLTSLPYEPGPVRFYMVISLVCSLAAAIALGAPPTSRWRQMAVVVMGALIIMDMLLSIYAMKHYLRLCRIRTHAVSFRPGYGGINIDLQNPKILPWVEAADFHGSSQEPHLWTLRDMTPLLDHVINDELMFQAVEVHNPRHVAYASWVNDPLMLDYVKKNTHLVSFVPRAVAASNKVWTQIVGDDLGREVLMVEDPPGPLPVSVAPFLKGGQKLEYQWVAVPNELKNSLQQFVDEGHQIIWDFPVPGNFPPYYATTVFTDDQSLRFVMQDGDKMVEFAPAQGRLVKPLTFDAQNIKEGKVFAAIPPSMFVNGAKAYLMFRQNIGDGLRRVWRHQCDQLGFDYAAPSDGWMMLRFPYDVKWEVVVDDKPVPFYRVNKSFIGLPVSRGEHRVLLRYWPRSWLRIGLLCSAFAATVGFFVLMAAAWRIKPPEA